MGAQPVQSVDKMLKSLNEWIKVSKLIGLYKSDDMNCNIKDMI
jgi:hypothetical protein